MKRNFGIGLLAGTLGLLMCCVALISNPRLATAQQKNKVLQQNGKQEQFILPQENKTCVADYQEQTGFAYGPFKLGMSFKRWKQVQEEMGFVNAIQKIAKMTDGKTASYKMTKPPMDIWGHTWKPLFLFIDDKGTYRLTTITGEFPKSDASDILKQLSAEYGEAEDEPTTGARIWTDGTTRISAILNEDGGAVLIYDRALYTQWIDQILNKPSSRP